VHLSKMRFKGEELESGLESLKTHIWYVDLINLENMTNFLNYKVK
jgi:hypothetical protein